MNEIFTYWQAADGVSRAVALVLLAMSVSVWVLMLWKGWVLQRVRADLPRAMSAFWAAADVSSALERVRVLDREKALVPLLEATFHVPAPQALAAQAQPASRLTRGLRNALHEVLARLQWGQVLLASVGATAPFVGLLGTVWGIYHALLGMSGQAALNLERVSGPVGEALVMTAAGLFVAIPAVLAFNVFGKIIGACEAELEGYAHDLRDFRLDAAVRTEPHADPLDLNEA
jgi:biopolymer transport protein ExbB